MMLPLQHLVKLGLLFFEKTDFLSSSYKKVPSFRFLSAQKRRVDDYDGVAFNLYDALVAHAT